MLHKAIVSFLLIFASGVSASVFAQVDTLKPVVIVGDVVSVVDKKFMVNAKTGPVEVTTSDKTTFKRVSAANLSLTAATAGSFAEIGAGDGLTISALADADGKTLNARTVYFVTKADKDAKAAKDAEAWKVRGITGKVISANVQTNQIVVETRTIAGSLNVTVTPKDGVKFLRYAQDSIRFDEAKASSLPEVKAGDMIRALGDRSSDGTGFAAEQVISGAFQTIAGTVKSVDAATGEVTITDSQTKKEVIVVVSETSVLKRFPAEQAEMLARVQMMGAGGPGGARPIGGGGQGRPAGGNPPVTPAGGQATPPVGGGRQMAGGSRGGGAGGVDDMLDRLPTITPADLKAGDMIAISSTKNGTAARIKAIKLVAGVEPFLRAAQVGAGGGRRGQGGVDGGFSIPGLDP